MAVPKKILSDKSGIIRAASARTSSSSSPLGEILYGNGTASMDPEYKKKKNVKEENITMF